MTPEHIQTLLESRFKNVVQVQDRFEVSVGAMRLIVMAHSDTDRLRIMVPVAAVDHADASTFQRLLEANFITTLDARYAIYSGILWAVVLTPLAIITEHVFEIAVTEVLQLAGNTGSSYCAWPSGTSARFAQLH
ncbi:MAG: hypothetical protein HY903_10635 [Deltaproteobacteria bacterium]|nr:hypothetical protein [Deltaproteobacteria bacterium]